MEDIELNKRFDRIDESINTLAAVTAKNFVDLEERLTTKIDGVDLRLSEVEEKLTIKINRVEETLSAKIEGVQRSVDGAYERHTALEARVTKLEILPQ